MQRAPEFKDTEFPVNFEKSVCLTILCPEMVNLTRPDVVRGTGFSNKLTKYSKSGRGRSEITN